MARDLPLATQRVLDLARALAAEPKVLILDEMTAALPTDLVGHVLRVVRAEADAGRGVIYISHRFAEIAELCDRATRAARRRDGGRPRHRPRGRGQGGRDDAGRRARARGRAPPSARAAGPVRLSVQAARRRAQAAGRLVRAARGRGAGRRRARRPGPGRAVRGARRAAARRPAGPSTSTVRRSRFRHPADAIARGLAFVPGNRADALLAQRPVRENIALPLRGAALPPGA